MLVRIADLADGKNVFTFTAAGDELGLDAEETYLAGPVTADVTVEKLEASLVFTGTVSFGTAGPCTRCLRPVERTFSVPFTMPGTVVDEGGEAPDDEGDMIVFGARQEQVDLTDVVREQVLMALPEKTLCSDACRGLCPGCGADLNVGKCACPDDRIDDRWQKLAELKNRKRT